MLPWERGDLPPKQESIRMRALSVGQPYNPSVSRYPECTQYNYRAGIHELVLFYGSPSKDEVYAARKGKAEFALFHPSHQIIILAHRFGDGLPWSDSPYSWHLVPEHERDLPSADLEQSIRAKLHVILVDAATGLVRAIRLVTFSPEFTRTLHQAIREQAGAPFDALSYDRELQATYARYTTTGSLVSAAAVRCVGGA